MSVHRSIPLSVALFGLLALPLVLVSNSHAQINGVPSSVTSPGFGGRPVNGAPPSVSSVGPRGFTPNPNSRVTFFTGNRTTTGDGHHHHHRSGQYAPSVFYAVPVPYSVDAGGAEDNTQEDDDANYQGGPTIFDRRGSGADSYVPPVKNIRRPQATETADADPPAPATPQEPTQLVFKNGHQLEVGNYAIVGDTLFDLTPGHVRKVALADLDLDATRKQNDDHGVTFQIPPSPQAN